MTHVGNLQCTLLLVCNSSAENTKIEGNVVTRSNKHIIIWDTILYGLALGNNLILQPHVNWNQHIVGCSHCAQKEARQKYKWICGFRHILCLGTKLQNSGEGVTWNYRWKNMLFLCWIWKEYRNKDDYGTMPKNLLHGHQLSRNAGLIPFRNCIFKFGYTRERSKTKLKQIASCSFSLQPS